MAKHTKQTTQLQVEQLEDRQLLASHMFLNSVSGVLGVTGSARSDTLTLSISHGMLKATLSGGVRDVGFFSLGEVKSVSFQGNGGHDRIINRANVAAHFGSSGPSLDSRSPQVAGADGLTPDEELIFQELNNYRASRGLPPLQINPLLQQDAQSLANEEAAKDTYGDSDQNGHIMDGHDFIWRAAQVGYNWRYLGENVAYNFGYSNPAQQLSDQWWTSPEHQANMLSPNYTQVGIGVAYGASGRIYGVEEFGSPMA